MRLPVPVNLNQSEQNELCADVFLHLMSNPSTSALRLLGLTVTQAKDRTRLASAVGALDEDVLWKVAGDLGIKFTRRDLRFDWRSKYGDRIGRWHENRFRLFISHLSAHKVAVAALSEALFALGVSGFVAHEDIQPARPWQDEMERALHEMDGLLAIIHPGFHESEWTEQEIGAAVGRARAIIPVTIGETLPRGFISKVQAQKGDGKKAGELARLIVIRLLNNPMSAGLMMSISLELFETSSSYAGAEDRAIMLKSAMKFTPRDLARVQMAVHTNDQVGGSWAAKPIVEEILRRHLR